MLKLIIKILKCIGGIILGLLILISLKSAGFPMECFEDVINKGEGEYEHLFPEEITIKTESQNYHIKEISSETNYQDHYVAEMSDYLVEIGGELEFENYSPIEMGNEITIDKFFMDGGTNGRSYDSLSMNRPPVDLNFQDVDLGIHRGANGRGFYDAFNNRVIWTEYGWRSAEGRDIPQLIRGISTHGNYVTYSPDSSQDALRMRIAQGLEDRQSRGHPNVLHTATFYSCQYEYMVKMLEHNNVQLQVINGKKDLHGIQINQQLFNLIKNSQP